MKYKNILMISSIIIIILIAIFLLNGKYNWVNTDIIGRSAVSSFSEIIKKIPDNIKMNELGTGWILEAPDNSAQFSWNENNNSYNVLITFDIKPFIDAGLDVSQLKEANITNDKIVLEMKLINEEVEKNGEMTPILLFQEIVETRRENISYHSQLDHFGVSLGNGNIFEWAKDSNKNDKDIVFVLHPEIFINAGVNPEKIEGWIFAKVKTMNESGKIIEVDKLLKPFNIK